MEVVPIKTPLDIDDPDFILEKAKGAYKEVLVVGYDEEGNLSVRCTELFANSHEAVYLLETLKHNILSGEYQDD